MGKVFYGNDYGYAWSRLGSTLIMIKGEPCVVSKIEKGKIFGASKFSGHYLEAPSEEVDLTPPRIGYVNTPEGARYCFRMPSRHYKQGLDSKNFKGPIGLKYYSMPVILALMNRYPPALTVADQIVNGEGSSGAFCKDFALSGKQGNLNLNFRGKKCGTASWNKLSQGLNYQLHEDYSYLQEMLEESL